MRHMRAGGHRTCIRRLGDGKRKALLIHCSLAHCGAWTGVMDHLGPGLGALAFDLPGHGQSDAWDGRTDPHDLSTAMAADLLGTDEMELVGHSFGATVALRLALEHPRQVRSLTLIEPVLFAAAHGTMAFDAFTGRHSQVMDAIARGDDEQAAQAFMIDWGGGADWAALPRRQRGALRAGIGFVGASDAALSQDRAGILAPGRLEALDRPVLLLEGANSPPIVAAIHDVIAARLPDRRRVRVPGAGHMLPVTHPAAVAAALARFLVATAQPVV